MVLRQDTTTEAGEWCASTVHRDVPISVQDPYPANQTSPYPESTRVW
jgi:hypothetical protein